MKNKIIIGRPGIKKVDSEVFGESARLCADVTMINPNTGKKETKECYFDFDLKYEKYLTIERSDAFIMGLLTSAMENNADIEFEVPISEELYYTMTTQYIPLIAKFNSKYPMHNISLIGPHSNSIIKNVGGVATGCSGGVDSFYTISKFNSDYEIKNRRLTHLVLSSIGTGDDSRDRIIKTFKENINYINQIASDSELDLIACFTNLYEFYKRPLDSFVTFYTNIYGSVAYALQKLLSIYYINSGDPISEFNLDVKMAHGYDASTFDVLTSSCMHTESLHFYTTGMDFDRIDKENYISNNPVARKYLKVCNLDEFKEEKMEKPNCSICPKCLRTMTQLYALRKLELYSDVFDVNSFLKHKGKYFGKFVATNKRAYVKETMDSAKNNGVKIPIGTYFYSYLWYKPIKFLRKKLKNVLFLRKIYYKLNIDYKLDGYRGANYQKYKDKI